MSIDDRIRNAARNFEDPHEGAEHLLAEYTRLSHLRRDVRKLVAEGIAGVQRAQVRSTEQQAFSPRPKAKTPESHSMRERKQLLEERFFAGPERGYVLWGEATVEDHRARIEYLRGQQRSIEE